MLIDLLDILRLFLEKMPIDVILASKPLVIKTMDFIAYRGSNADRLYDKLGEFLEVG